MSIGIILFSVIDSKGENSLDTTVEKLVTPLKFIDHILFCCVLYRAGSLNCCFTEGTLLCFYIQNGDTWKLKRCTKCSCHHGVVRCGVEECISAPVCPPKKKLVTPPGKCCPTCVEGKMCVSFGTCIELCRAYAVIPYLSGSVRTQNCRIWIGCC